MLRRQAAVLLIILASCHASKESTIPTAERDAPLPGDQGAIGGVVRDAANGRTLPMVTLQAERDGEVVAVDMSNERGLYRLGPLAPGSYKVTARFASARVGYEGILVVAKSETPTNVQIDLRNHASRGGVTRTGQSLGTIRGVVLDSIAGNHFPGAVVSLYSDQLADAVMAIADEEGVFRFPGLKPGRYSLSCYYHLVDQGNVEVRRGNIEVRSGEVTDVELELELHAQ
jgi:hypothetical protein